MARLVKLVKIRRFEAVSFVQSVHHIGIRGPIDGERSIHCAAAQIDARLTGRGELPANVVDTHTTR